MVVTLVNLLFRAAIFLLLLHVAFLIHPFLGLAVLVLFLIWRS